MEGLTAKEREVLEIVLDGKSRKEIAAELHLSENTVKTHWKISMASGGGFAMKLKKK